MKCPRCFNEMSNNGTCPNCGYTHQDENKDMRKLEKKNKVSKIIKWGLIIAAIIGAVELFDYIGF